MSTEMMSRFLEGLQASRLLDVDRIEEVLRRPESPQGDVDGISKFLETSGWLTGYQISEIRQGRGQTLMFAAYRLLERLADQPSGPVYRAYHPALKQAVIIRWLTADWIGPADDMRSFIERAQAASLLSHSHVLGTLDAGWIGDTPFLVQESFDGADLTQLVNEMGALPVSLACEYSRQAAVALQAAHDRGLFHGDFSPERMILAPINRKPGVNGSGQSVSIRPAPGAAIKVSDIGLVPRRPPIGQLSFMQTSLLGAAHFLAPERLTEGSQSIEGDIYSLGASIYFLLAARPPFPAGSAADALAQLQHAVPERIDLLRNDVPPALADYIHELLSKDPTQRPHNAGDVARFLQSYCKLSSAGSRRPDLSNAVPLAGATGSVPNALPGIMTQIAESRFGDRDAPGQPSERPLIEALPESTSDSQVFSPRNASAMEHHPNGFHEEPHDVFGQHGGDSAPRIRRSPEAKGSGMTWMILGGCLHLVAICLLLYLLKIWPFSDSAPKEEEPVPHEKQNEKRPERQPQPNKKKRLTLQSERIPGKFAERPVPGPS